MENKSINTQDKIFKAAYDIFLLYGFHGTTLHQIAVIAGVNHTAIHYYFRSKEKLYARVVSYIIDNILKPDNSFVTSQNTLAKQSWFLSTELYNNQQLFKKTIINLYPDSWEKILSNIINLSQHSFLGISGLSD